MAALERCCSGAKKQPPLKRRTQKELLGRFVLLCMYSNTHAHTHTHDKIATARTVFTHSPICPSKVALPPNCLPRKKNNKIRRLYLSYLSYEERRGSLSALASLWAVVCSVEQCFEKEEGRAEPCSFTRNIKRHKTSKKERCHKLYTSGDTSMGN